MHVAPGGSENLTSTPPPPLTGADDLLALARTTDDAINAPIPGSQEAAELERQAAAQPKLSLERELAGMFALVGTGLGQFLPRAGAVLTAAGPDNKTAADHLGDVLAPVARKYGLDGYLAGFAWRVELQAVMVAGPIAFAIVRAAKLDIAELERLQAAAEGRPPASPVPQAELDRRELAAMEEIHTELANPPPAQPGMLQPIQRPTP